MMDAITDAATGARCYQTMVPMRDGARLNTFVFVPPEGGPRFPAILHRTPYGIAAAAARDKFRELAATVLTPQGTRDVEAAVDRCDEWTSVGELTELLRRSGRS